MITRQRLRGDDCNFTTTTAIPQLLRLRVCGDDCDFTTTSIQFYGSITRQLYGIEGPLSKAHHFATEVALAASDASSNQWGGVVAMPEGEFSAGGGFPHSWLPAYIYCKDTFALAEVLTLCCGKHPGGVRRVQLSMDVDSSSVVDAFSKGCPRNPVTHKLLVKLFDLQVAEGL